MLTAELGGLFAASPPAPIPPAKAHHTNGIFRDHMNGSPAPHFGRNSPRHRDPPNYHAASVATTRIESLNFNGLR